MALSNAQQFANAFSQKVNPGSSFLDRFAHDVGNTAKGFVPGLLEIGKTVGHDIGQVATGGTNFKLDNLGGSMAKGFMQQSFIPKLLTGQPVDAWNRFSAAPFSGLLDATLVAPAFTGATKLGSRVGSLESRGNFASLGGYRLVAPDTAQAFSGVLSGIAGGTEPSMFGSMPATMNFMDGSTRPTREFMGLGKTDTQMIGDQLWARPVHRTITPTVKTDELSTAMRDKNNNPSGTLDDDLSQKLVMPRAENELWAMAGDAAAPLFAKAFPGFVSRRWGKKLARDTMRDGLVAGDQANYHYGAAISQLEPALERIASDLPEEDRYRAVGLATLADAHGKTPDEMHQVRDYYSADSLPIPEKLTEDLYHLKPYEFMRQTNTGFFPYSMDDKGNRLFADPLTHPDADLTIQQLIDKHGPELANRFSYESVSPAMLDAFERQAKARQDFYVHLDESLADSSRNGYQWYVKDKEGQKRPITREELQQNPSMVDELDHNYIHPQRSEEFSVEPNVIRETLDKLKNVRTVNDLHQVDDRIVKSLMDRWKDERRANPEGPSRAAVYVRQSLKRMLDEGGINERKGTLSKLSKDLREAQYYTKTLKDSTSGALGMSDLHRGLVTRVEGGLNNPGIVNVLNEIADDTSPMAAKVRALMETEEYQKWREYKDAVTRTGKGLEYERLDAVLGDGAEKAKERLDWNEQRLRRYMNDDSDGGSYFPMRYVRKEAPEGVAVDTSPHLSSLDELGDTGKPYEVYLSGQFDLDPNVHVRNLKRQNDDLTQARLGGRIKQFAVEISGEDLKRHGRELTPESKLGSSRHAGKFVLLEKDGPLDRNIKKIRSDLESMSYELKMEGTDDVAEDLIDLLDTIDPEISDKRNLALPTEAYKSIQNEISTGVEALGKFYELYRDAGDWWKFTVLHARFPSWFRNNWIGAQLMLLMSGGLTKMGSAYANSLKWKSPENHEFLGEAFPQARSLGSAQQARGLKLMRMVQDGGPLAKFREKLLGKLNQLSDINADYADSPARLARVSQIMDERVSQLVRLGKEHGVDIQDTPELRQRMVEHEPTRHGIAQEMLRDMVDFSDMGRMEREWIIAILPFWSWMKGSGKAITRLELDHPERIWGMEQVADVGERESIDDAGQAAPDFARSWFNLGGDKWLSTGGWNPYEAPLDLMNMGLGFVPGGMSYRQFGSENILGNMNPVISGGTAAVLGKDPFFGTPLPNDNPMDTFWKMQMKNPVIDTFMRPFRPQGPTSTTNKSVAGSLANMMGVPVVDPRWGQVWSRGVDEAQERYRNPGMIGILNPPAVGIS